MRTSSDRLRQIERLARRIDGAGVPQVVFSDFAGRLDCFPANTPRHAAMLASPEFARRIVGVYSPGVSVPLLAAGCRG